MTNNFENENNDEFSESEISAPEDGGRSSSAAGNLAEAWRTRPFFKFMVLVVAVFAIGAAAINFFGGNSGGNEIARLGKPPALKEAPGGEASPYMRQQTELANSERAQQAIATGGSAIPTPLGQTTDVANFGMTGKKEDPLKELRAETEMLKKQVQQQQQVQRQQAQQRQPEQFDNTLAEAMQRQMQQLLASWTPTGIKSALVSKQETPGKDESGKSAQGAALIPATATTAQKNLVNAGTVSYAQLLTEANSDVPGPILAQIVSGPLSGARAVGSFQVSEGYEKYLVLNFSLADKAGKDYQINAIALDPDTTLGGMATEVDERYFARVVLPSAAAFIQGIGQAMGQGNTSITTNGTTTITTQAGHGFRQGLYSGLGQGANTIGQFFQQQANVTKPLVRIAAGTPIGMFFISSVKESSANMPYIQQNQGAGYNGAYPPVGINANYPGNNPNYPGNIVPGYGANSQNANSVPYPNYATSGYGYVRGAPSVPSSPYGVMPFSPYTQQSYGQ
jgi:intracellular multiplication protein IcmE